MKLLIAYDGSPCAEAAIDDLNQAGLQPAGLAHVMSVAEVWLPPPDMLTDPNDKPIQYIEEIVRAHRARGERILADASVRVKQAESRMRNILRDWTITSSATYGSPAWEILSAADDLSADLIVVGSHGHSALSRFFLGSVSQKVLTEAHCSVRVARGKIEVEPSGRRLIVGFDGSRGSQAAVNSIAGRSWPAGTEVRFITATEAISPSDVSFVPPIVRRAANGSVAEEHWVEQLADAAIERLAALGLKADLHFHTGNPKSVLVHEAESWGADCIFVGANAFGSRLERVLLGSTSAAVAARAHCSVEVVRIRAQI